jgi:cytochrome P450
MKVPELVTQVASDDLDFDWLEPNAMAGKHILPRIRKIQDQTPLFWSESRKAWLVTRYSDLIAALKDERFSNHRMHKVIDFDGSGRAYDAYPNFMKAVLRWIQNSDGAEHRRLRGLLLQPFSKSNAERSRSFAVTVLEEMIAREEKNGILEVEFLAFAYEYTIIVLMSYFDFQAKLTVKQMKDWAGALAEGQSPSPREPDKPAIGERAIIEINEVLRTEIAAREANPGNDLLSSLLQASKEGDRLTVDDIVSLFQVILLGGFETVSMTLTYILMNFADQPEPMRYIRDHPESMVTIIRELQRHTAVLNSMPRVAAQDFELHGQQIRSGDLIYLLYAGANHDPRAFPEPEKVKFDRPASVPPATFGPGLHHCLGNSIANMELEVALKIFCERYTKVEVLTDEPNYSTNPIQRTIKAVEMRFTR